MAAPSTSKASVVFAGGSALRILRAAQSAGVRFQATTKGACLPSRSPRLEQVRSAIDLVEGMLAGLRLERPVTLLAGAGAHRSVEGLYAVSSCSAALPKGSLLRVAKGVFVCSPELAFLREAGRGVDDVELLELGFELCGIYCSELTGPDGRYGAEPLATARALGSFARRNERLQGAARARRLAELVADRSASPRETKLALLVGLPLAKGGSGLGMPLMNHEVVANRQASLVAQRTSFRCDLCWPAHRVDVEYQSRLIHANEASRIADSQREKALRVMGWRVVAVTNEELDNVAGFEVIARMLRKELGKDPRIRLADYYERRLALRAQLGLPVAD